MRFTTARPSRSSSQQRGVVICISLVTLFLSLLTPLTTLEATDTAAASARLAQGVPPDCEPGFIISDDGIACIADPDAQQPEVPTEIPVDETPVTVETPIETATATEVATEAPPAETLHLTINVFRCDNLAFDPYLSDNAQMVLDTCTGQGSGTFEISSSIPVASQTGSTLEFQVGPGLAIQELLQPGYGNPIANCFLLDASGNVVDQIGPGVANGGGWRVGDTSGDVHCDWYQIEQGDDQVALDPTPNADAPVASPAASPAASPLADGTGAIMIFTFNCPAGFDVSTIDANPRGTCPPAPNVSFNIDDTKDDGKSHTVVTNSFGQGGLGQLPSDTYTIAESVPNGVTATFLWDCYATNTTSSRTDPLGTGSVAQFELADGAGVRCDWFNVTGGSGRVVVSTHGCAANVPAYVLGYEQLLARCSIDTGAIRFLVTSGYDGMYSENRTASSNPLTLASFDGVPSGTTAVIATIPGGWGTPIVYCQVLGADGSIVSPPTGIDLLGGQMFGVEVEPGQTVGCDWFNVTAGKVLAYMQASTCPAGFDAYAYADQFPALEANCREDAGKVNITISGGERYFETRTTISSYPPAPAAWSDAPSGRLTITGASPAGYGRPIVYCSTKITDGNTIYSDGGFVNVGVGGSIEYAVPPGQQFDCRWFLVPGGTGYVSLVTQACPEGFDIHNASRFQFEQGCNEPVGTVDFTVASGSFTEAKTTDIDDYVDFPSVPSGDLTVTQTSATDFETAVVYCYELVQGTAVTPKERVEVSADRSIPLRLKADGWQQCEWFLGHLPEGTITVAKWDCPEPLTAGGDLSYYEGACTQTRDGVDFTVTGVASSSTQTTANGGKAQWQDVQPGLVTVTEHIPKGYGQPIAFCSGPKMDQSFLVTNGAIEYELLEGDYLTCDWFNVPLEKGQVVVNTWICAEDTTYDRDFIWYQTSCAKKHDGVEFGLTHGNGAQPETTDANGQVRWIDVPLGPISIQEHTPKGYGEPVVFCTAGSDAALAQAQRMEAPGGLLKGELVTGLTLYTCHWFNIHHDGVR